jgi:hypothetical protein
MKTNQTRIEYLAVFVFVYSNVHGKKRPKHGQPLVVYKNAPCILIGARYYDPETATWLSPDSKGQYFSPYKYTSNPVLLVDKDGNFFFLPILIGAFIGAYQGIQIGAAHGAEGWNMIGYALGGALTGAGMGLLAGSDDVWRQTYQGFARGFVTGRVAGLIKKDDN